MNRWLLTFFCLCLVVIVASAQNGFRLEVKLDNYKSDSLFFGILKGVRGMPFDTAILNKKGSYVFEADTALADGIYVLIYKEQNMNRSFPIMVTQGNQQFEMQGKYPDLMQTMQFTKSNDNVLYYQYINFIQDKKKTIDALLARRVANYKENELKEISDSLMLMDKSIFAYQVDFSKKNLHPMLAGIVQKATLPVFPDKALQEASQWYIWKKQHFFDNLDLTDPDILRIPQVFDRIDNYIFRSIAQKPDSLINAIDEVLNKMKPNVENFRYFLSYFLNTFARSAAEGSDQVYVHLAQEYYAKGIAPWTQTDQLNKIISNANTLEKLLVGKNAPDLRMFTKDSTAVTLYDINSPYTLLVFWDPECGHCKKEVPVISQLYDTYKDKGLTVFAVCNRLPNDIKKCWDYIDTNKLDKWINVADPLQISRYRTTYDLRLFPQLFLLDANKKIIYKRIGEGEHLDAILEKFLVTDRK